MKKAPRAGAGLDHDQGWISFALAQAVILIPASRAWASMASSSDPVSRIMIRSDLRAAGAFRARVFPALAEHWGLGLGILPLQEFPDPLEAAKLRAVSIRKKKPFRSRLFD